METWRGVVDYVGKERRSIMLIEEKKFRMLCRGEYGGNEGQKFQEALDEYPDKDPVPVMFDEYNPMRMPIPRSEAEGYAEMARQERQPEEDLILHIKPQMRNWIRINRGAMCARLRKSLETYSPEHHNGLTIIWEIQSPDKVDVSLAKAYLEAYEL